MSRRILVVDDSPTLVKFVSYSLKSSGYEVVGASDGMDALEKMSNLETDIDLVITDLNMPNVDGYELIATLRKNDKFAATPIIILSSEEGEEDKQKGQVAGATSYLVKPFKSSVLLAEVARLLD
jgi:two-component system, chemotaxis family, chemotaxis protein CheY